MDENTADRGASSHTEPDERPAKRSSNKEKRNKNYGVSNLMKTSND